MKNARKSFEKETRQLLEYIVLHGDLPKERNLNMQALKECCEMKWISGVVVQTMISGHIVADVCQVVTVTKAGLDYLHPKRDVKFMVSSVIAVVSIIVNLLQAFL